VENLDRPHCTVVLAITADGKISDRPTTAARFGSPRDLAHLETQVAQADAVLFGAATLRAYHTTLSVRNPDLIAQRRQRGQPPQPRQWVCSRPAEFDPQWRFFQQPIPRGLITTDQGAIAWQGRREFGQIITTGEAIAWPPVFNQWQAQGVERVAVLGGGVLVGSLLAGGWVDELRLTLCPLLLGATAAPMAAALPAGVQLELLSCGAIASEVFLHYRVLSMRKEEREERKEEI